MVVFSSTRWACVDVVVGLLLQHLVEIADDEAADC